MPQSSSLGLSLLPPSICFRLARLGVPGRRGAPAEHKACTVSCGAAETRDSTHGSGGLEAQALCDLSESSSSSQSPPLPACSGVSPSLVPAFQSTRPPRWQPHCASASARISSRYFAASAPLRHFDGFMSRPQRAHVCTPEAAASPQRHCAPVNWTVVQIRRHDCFIHGTLRSAPNSTNSFTADILMSNSSETDYKDSGRAAGRLPQRGAGAWLLAGWSGPPAPSLKQLENTGIELRCSLQFVKGPWDMELLGLDSVAHEETDELSIAK